MQRVDFESNFKLFSHTYFFIIWIIYSDIFSRRRRMWEKKHRKKEKIWRFFFLAMLNWMNQYVFEKRKTQIFQCSKTIGKRRWEWEKFSFLHIFLFFFTLTLLLTPLMLSISTEPVKKSRKSTRDLIVIYFMA